MWTDEAANIATVVGAGIAFLGLAGGLWSYLRSGPKVSIEIIPPNRNRKNKAPTDRTITVSVSNHGSAPALISKLRLRTIKLRNFFWRETTNEALFDDSTPWSPSITLMPGDAKTYDLKFFEGWTQSGKPPEKIEVAVFLRGIKKPAVASV
ncbi:MAG: hypothetical protein V7774_03685 [Pseudorhizobium pelagicum]|uniref:hypothetical protein n=1 Tax=Pseudorhizobium pelagicum TaxID=1509405 RepID=UPI00346154F6